MRCLGESVLNDCKSAKGVFSNLTGDDPAYQATFNIFKEGDKCYFKLDTNQLPYLSPIKQNLTTQESIQCPVDTVKTLISNIKSSPKFPLPTESTLGVPNKTNALIYAAQIFDYGLSTIYFANNFDQTKIENSGCSGGLISKAVQSSKDSFQKFTKEVQTINTTVVPKALDGEIENAIGEMRANAAMYYDQHYQDIGYKNVCQTFSTDMNKLTKINVKNVKCYDSKDSYAVSAPSAQKGFILCR